MGRVGDFYLDRRAGALYGPKVRAGRRPWGSPVGLQGVAGPDGVAGPSGTRGPQGAAGASGANGAPGADGARGQRGYSVLNGRGAPAPWVGIDGDFYVDTDTTQMYGPRASGVWGSPTNLTGPASPADNAVYRALAANPESLIAGAIDRGRDGVVTSAEVQWPDATPGRFVVTRFSDAFSGAVDAYEITYGDPATRTYAQPPVARDPDSGAVTVRPGIVVR